MELAKPSFIRESLKLAAEPNIISFGGGNPDANYFPADALLSACEEALRLDWRNALQYAITEGNIELRKILLALMEHIGISAELSQIIITSGSQQGLDMTGKVFLDPGDKVIVESPTYMGAINAFKYYQPQFLEVAMDEQGMDMDDLERVLNAHPDAKFIYTVPDFQNPTGRVLSGERRRRLVELAEQYDVMVIEDNPYYFLRFEGTGVPPVKAYDKYGRVIFLGSMSKILSPSLRIGWIIGPETALEKYVILKQAADIHTNELSQRMVAQFFLHENLDQHIALINKQYKVKKDLMVQKISDCFPAHISFTKPEGGLFLWLELPEKIDAQEIFQCAYADERVIFVPGETFYANGGHRNTIRLCFSSMSTFEIDSGMDRLAAVLKNFIS